MSSDFIYTFRTYTFNPLKQNNEMNALNVAKNKRIGL
jgi:hypothetical protein